MSSLGVSGSRSNSHHESLSLRSMSRTLSADVESNAANHATRNPDDFVSANANTQRVQRAVSKAVSVGKSISGLLSDALEQSSLARNEDSNLHILVELAAGLQNYQSPIEFTIGFVGDSGVGKSSLINSLLDHENLAKTAGVGRACTTVVTEYRQRRESDNTAYTIEIDRLDDEHIEELLCQSVVDYRRYHLREPGNSESTDEELRVKAQIAWDTLKAAFEDREGCTEVAFRNPGTEIDHIQQLVLGWKDELVWPAGFNTDRTVLRADAAADCVARIDEVLALWMWPFVKVMRIYLTASVLRNGIVLVDLPGFRDVNTARVKITETRLYQCDTVFIVTPIGRAVTDVGVENMTRQLGNNFEGLRHSQGVAIVCTRSEDLGHESEIIRDVPINRSAMEDLDRRIEDAMGNDTPHMLLDARLKELLISARNNFVKNLLVTHYATQPQSRQIDILCVSNTLYREGRKRQQMQARRESLTASDRIQAGEQMLASSRIDELRNFCQGIPLQSQIAEARHFLKTRLRTLLEKTELWLTASVPDIVADQQATPGFIEVLQNELRTQFHASVEATDEGLSNAKREMLQRPISLPPRWEREALLAVNRWERWHAATWSTFWNHEGAHSTRSHEYTDWNAEILKAMVEDMQPSEELFRSECETLFTTFKESISEHMSELTARLGDLHGVEVFATTLPRRRRNFDYEVDNVTTSFHNELQHIFLDLFKTHGTSYVMRHMQPMYNETYSGDGMRDRCIHRLKLQITGDRTKPKLFRVIRDLLVSAIESLLERTHETLENAVNQCCVDIGIDLGLLRGEEVPALGEEGIIATVFDILDQSKARVDVAEREFESGVVTR